VEESSKPSFSGFVYKYFNWFGGPLSRVFFSNGHAKVEEALEDAGIKMYPQAYFSLVGFLFIVVMIITVPTAILTGLLPILLVPLLVILLGYAVPNVMSRDRAQKLDMEVPFAGTYISVMATGGLSPYASMRRLKNCPLLPNISKTVKDMEVDVQVKGYDPVTAMEKSAQHLPSKDYRDLLMGYASTLRTGGDVIHYLLVRTETMFRDLAIKVKAFGERAAMLMESYIAISILVTLSLTILFMTSIAFSNFWQGFFTADNFLIYSYFIVPIISMLFIYMADMGSFHEPINEWGPYKVLLATSPIFFFMLITMFVPFAAPDIAPSFSQPFSNAIIALRQTLGLERGYEASLGISLALIAWTAPAAFAHSYYMKRGKGLESDITHFLRDLTEARKTGASPEKCIETLSGRKYGAFTKQLQVTSRQIRWGLPFKVIYDTFKTKIKSWLPQIDIYLLVDAVEVGGGSPETLETLTRFSEMFSSLEKEKKETLRPLIIMPYIGAAILLFSTVVFMGFMRYVLYSFGRQAMPFGEFATLLLPPLILQVWLTGLVTGKISSGTLSSGFQHATILVIAAIVLMVFSGYLSLPFQW
jgi:flagellar protein FlaJ